MAMDTEIAWLAGITDGEGCIYGHWVNRGRCGTDGNVCAEVRIEATSKIMIETVARICGDHGIIATIDYDRCQPKATKVSHRVNVRKRDSVVAFLKLIRPYLVVKANEADEVIAWYEKWGDQRGVGKRKASHEQKLMLFNTLRNLKKVA